MQLVLKHIPMNLSNFIIYIIHCLTKVGLHALSMLMFNSVICKPLYLGEKCSDSLNEEQTFIFNFVEDILFFSRSIKAHRYPSVWLVKTF